MSIKDQLYEAIEREVTEGIEEELLEAIGHLDCVYSGSEAMISKSEVIEAVKSCLGNAGYPAVMEGR